MIKHQIFCCTKGKAEDTALYKNLQQFPKIQKHIAWIENNSYGLSYNYNKCMELYKNTIDSMIFCHDDIEFTSDNIFKELELAYEQFDVVGLAGGTNPEIKTPTLWHLMCKRENYFGRVGHYHGNEKFVTNFGPTPHRVTLLDGLFLAINLKKVKDTNFKFDNQFDFHLYDLDACLTANNEKLKLGVWPILVYHKSPGLRDLNDRVFQKNQAAFIAKYS